MLIIDRNHIDLLLPVYEVKEVSVKEALALLKSAQADPEAALERKTLPIGGYGACPRNGLAPPA